MATWGPSKKREQRALPAARNTSPARTSSTRSASTRSAASSSSGNGSGARNVARARYSKTDDNTDGKGRRRAEATGELRRAVAGREHEFYGLILIVAGVIFAAGVYFNVAGPLGDGVDWLVGALAGLARYVVPIILIAMGVALVRSARSSSPWRLVFGWTFVALAGLGILHIAKGPTGFSVDGVTKAGGVLGWAVGEPLRTLIADFGAIVLFVAIGLVGAMLVTQASLHTMAQRTGKMAQRTGRGMGAVAAPLGRAARHALRDLSSLSSDGDADEDPDRPAVLDEPEPESRPALALPAAPYDDGPYDAGDDTLGTAAASSRARASCRPPAGTTASGAAPTGNWMLPPVSLLHRTGAQTIDRKEVETRGKVLQESLQQHGVDTTLAGMTIGPTVTRFELELAPGVKVARVTSLQKDIAYAMAATDVRILAPIPGKSAIGVEVPNNTRQLVALGDLLVSPEAGANVSTLDVAVGKDIAGQAVFLDLATTPHLLIAGATGAGKSSGINCILTSLLMRTTPDQVRLILIDPKQVEMGQYNRLPHLLTQPVTNPKKAANALGWACKEMDRRYDILSDKGFRDITGYNAAFDRGALQPELALSDDSPGPERLPFIVVVVDELNDLMMVAARDVEDSITRIAQKARAVGIHLIVATQRPSVNVITGVIKANIPARMAFAVSSLTDSRVILDQPGAEKLVDKGDMLLLPGNTSNPHRVQGSFVSEEAVRAVVAHWREQAPEVTYVSGVDGADDAPDLVTSSSNSVSAGGDDDDDAMMRQAMELVVRSQLGSTSMLQRKLKVGFARAGRIMDLLEQQGIVGPSEGSKARNVMMTVEEFEALNPRE
ncbi:MAG: DNA translocase FtsK [Actinomycetota bacterium]|nr:DNA translocase FtsK [Actinomycetota bacterium]